jgi:hypothetical protein
MSATFKILLANFLLCAINCDMYRLAFLNVGLYDLNAICNFQIQQLPAQLFNLVRRFGNLRKRFSLFHPLLPGDACFATGASFDNSS